MTNNVIELYRYEDPKTFDFTAYNRRAKIRFRSSQIRFWVNLAVDTLATLAVAGCTVFCCWVALTML